jgi:S1-C subfamily serine protease
MKTTLKVAAIVTVFASLFTAASAAERLPVGLVPDDRIDIGTAVVYSEYLGLALESHNGRGLKVESVEQGGAAASAGLESGDIIIGADGYYVDTLDELETTARHSYGTVKLVVRDVRTGRNSNATMTITSGVIGTAVAYVPGLNLSVEMMPRGGYKVGEIERGTLAAKLGLKAGDVLLTVNGQPIEEVDAQRAFGGSFTLAFDQASTGYRMTVKRMVSR